MKMPFPVLLLAAAAGLHAAPHDHDHWHAGAELVVSGSLGTSTAGEGYEDALANAHTDPMHTGLAFGSAELLASFGRPLAGGQLDVGAVFHVHRHPGEVSETELDEMIAGWARDGLRVQAGIFFAPIGFTNTRHAHARDFVNAPLLYGRFLGSRGLRNPGMQLEWGDREKGSSWAVAIQRATGDTALSFRSDHGGGDYLGRAHSAAEGSGPLITLRQQRAYQWTEGRSLFSGLAFALGDNGSGGSTRLVAWDIGWRQNQADGSGRSVQAEFFWRHYEALAGIDALGSPVAADTLQDLAFALSARTEISRTWTAGLRWERAMPLDRADYESTARDSAREARSRLCALLGWEPAEGWQLRLQYDRDQSPAFGSEDSVWLTAQWSIGRH